jgi:hypothetical protein
MAAAFAARASDCVGDDCFIEPLYNEPAAQVGGSMDPPMFFEMAPTYDDCEDCGHFWMPEPRMNSVNLISVKPVVPDTRRPLWDGGIKKYDSPAPPRTMNWRDGEPVWDNSISNYKKKDFRDWFLEPKDTYLADELNTDIQAQVEELLAPMRPKENLWSSDPRESYPNPGLDSFMRKFADNVQIIESGDGCPFETAAECDIWRKKPMVRETLSPRSPKIRAEKMQEFICAARDNNRIKADSPAAAPLLERYKMLLNSARACCTDGMAHELKRAGATDGLVYKFLSDDANFYGLGGRCLMMTDTDFDTKYPNTATAAVAADVRNGCLCRSRQWFRAMLAPFADAFEAVPEFAKEKFDYTYVDGLQRQVTVSINNDVRNVLDQLALCP